MTTPPDAVTAPKLAPGRYCLATCYCGLCPHHVPYRLTGRQVSQLQAYLRHAPRYVNGNPSPSWWADPPGGSR
jgi:hypothetical protein